MSMDRKYSNREMKSILTENIEASSLVEEKIQEAYDIIRADALRSKNADEKTSAAVVSVSKLKKKRKLSWLLPAAAACVLLTSAVTAVAFGGFFTKTKVQKADTLHYEFDVDYELQPYRMTVTPGYIPEGYKAMDESGLKYCKDDFWQNGISLCVVSADYLGMDGSALFADNVKNIEETEINGMEADLITLNYDKERVTRTFDKRIYLFNSQEGYVGIVNGGNDLSMEELVKVAENLVFTKTDEKVEPVDLEKLKKEQKAQAEYNKELKEKIRKKYEEGISEEQVFEKGEAFVWGYEDKKYEIDDRYELTVLESEIVDSAAGLLAEGFYSYDVVSGRMNEDKTLKPYERVTYRGWDPRYAYLGGEEISRETAGQKFLTVKIQAVNMSKETQDFWAGAAVLQNLKEEQNGRYPYDDIYTEPLNGQEYGLAEQESPVYFDGSPYEAPNSHFFYRELAPGEKFIYTLAYIVDEDRTENLYLNFGGAISTNQEFMEHYEKYVKVG